MKENKEIKTLVLGANGNLGSQIVRELQSSCCCPFYAWTRADCDLTDLSDMKKKINELHPTVIVNTVAYNNVDACEHNIEEQKKAINLNVKLVECLAELCQDARIKLIHFSTNYVFSGNQTSYDEFDKPSPINFYGLTKLMGEESIINRLKYELSGCIIRVSNLFGPCGTSVRSKPNFFDLIYQAAKRDNQLSVVCDERCCFTYTRDVARTLIEKISDTNFNGIYHFVNTNPLSWYEAAEIYFKLLNIPVHLQPVSKSQYTREAKRPNSAILVSTRSKPMREFKLALQEYIDEDS